jgi:hypothetical protein
MDAANNKPEKQFENDDYLWDGSGKPDPEIQKLETLLAKYKHAGTVPVLPADVVRSRWAFFPFRLRLFPALVTAAAVALIATAAFVIYARNTTPATVAGWDVSRISGTPRIGQSAIGGKSSRLGVGEVLETDDQSRARLQATDVGQIEIESSTRVRLLDMGATRKQIALDHGTINAYIWAPAGQFVVDTPSARTVDLGCAYSLRVDDSGAGIVRTWLGWVGFKLNGRESFIPAGAACATRPKVGPGTPYLVDASASFRTALQKFDFEDTTPQQRAADLDIVLAESHQGDELTLWHLLSRVDEDQRGRVYDRLKQLVPPPARVTRAGILRLDQPMLDLWWNQLGYDDISVWRHWEHSWTDAVKSGEKK